jgi:D-alanyl-D-alanine carboxypeptidase
MPRGQNVRIAKTRRDKHSSHIWLFWVLTFLLSLFLFALDADAAPRAAIVMDTRNGQVYVAEDADKQLHPASLTKMMTLYIAFEALAAGELDPDERVVISARAAAVTGSSLNLTTGERVTVNDLITATAIKSANDAATALAEAISGDVERFVARMNDTAARIGMTRTQFMNPHGLTAEGHLSTARDMSLLGRQLFFDYPEFFELFSKVHATAAGRKIAHTNRRFLGAYSGADGIKTGYTRAAGYNLTASAQRGQKRLIVTVFGAASSADRTERVAALMNKGFQLAQDKVEWVAPRPGHKTRRSNGLLFVAASPQGALVAGMNPNGQAGVSGFGSVHEHRHAQIDHIAEPPSGTAPSSRLQAASLGGVSLGAIVR